MNCCIVRDDGAIEPLLDVDGSEETYYEPQPMAVKEPGKPVEYMNLSTDGYTRHTIFDHFGKSILPPAGCLYARSAPTPEQKARALNVLAAM